MSRPIPFGFRVLLLAPFQAEGVTPSGISIVHHSKLPTIYGRVTAVHPSCRYTRVGDWIVYQPRRPVRLSYSGGVVYALEERQVLGVVEPGDGRPWFEVPSPQ